MAAYTSVDHRDAYEFGSKEEKWKMINTNWMSTSLSHNNLSYNGSLWIENRNIHKDPGTTSFKMMSSEYVMTGYGKFL